MAEDQEVTLEQIMWHDVPVTQLIAEGWRPHRKVKRDGSEYLTIRKGKQERSLGRYDAKKHAIIKKALPPPRTNIVQPTPELIDVDENNSAGLASGEEPNELALKVTEGDETSSPRKVRPPQSTLLRMPIQKHVVFPKSYVPTIKVMRYFEILKERGYNGDFNQFVNEVVETHFEKCHGIYMPLVYVT